MSIISTHQASHPAGSRASSAMPESAWSCPVILACDNAYAMPLATTLRSLAESNEALWPLDVTVLTNDTLEVTKEKVRTSLPAGAIQLRWARVDLSLFRHFRRLNHVSEMTYARLQIPNVFGDEVSTVLYLDADLLVLRSLADLMRTELQGAPLAAVRDHHVDSDLKSSLPAPAVRVPQVDNYFNAGVLLIDLREWRRQQITPKALEYLNEHPDSPYLDQDALNVACGATWMELDSTWNFQNHHTTRIDRQPAAQRPAIVHFITSSKPWKPSSSSINAALYDRFRRRTLFRRSPSAAAWASISTLAYRIKYRLRREAAALPSRRLRSAGGPTLRPATERP